MHFIKFLFLLILLLIRDNGVLMSCQFQEQEIRNEWRLILQQKANGRLGLLRENSIDDGSVLYMICNEKDVTQLLCTDGQFNIPLPLPYCSNPLRPKLQESHDFYCPYTAYCVGFEFSCDNDQYFVVTYRICFDHKHMRAVYTANKAYPYFMRRPDNILFNPDEMFTMNLFAAYNKRDIYARFRELLGSQQPFMTHNEQERRIDRGHLVPVADFITNNMMSSTFKMINVIPQFHSINSGNWNILEEWARNPINTPAKVCSGALSSVLKLPNSNDANVSMYLRNELIPIPLWTFKVVLNSQGVRTVFLQYNNIHDTTPPDIPNDTCLTVPCPPSLNLKDSNFYGYTVCCEQKHFMRKNLQNLEKYC
uniref:DNA/RNA non-specific endonuclease/pyrophosphatase/phosphodiesterase domain-containing protein n=1 Tax=Glossina brevipalpis TaxID=37001 RepID=A0A1A9WCF5_9MUSC